MNCPRCSSARLEELRVTSGTGSAATVHHCGACAGLWLDNTALPTICPTLAHLPDHRGEVALLGRRGLGIQRCPRCEIMPYEFTVLEVPVDVCLRCAGIWLDGDEYEEAMLEDLTAPAPGREGRGGPYRKAASLLRSRGVRCVACRDPLAVEDAYMREEGLTCGKCHFTEEQLLIELRAQGVEERRGPILKAIVAILEAILKLLKR